MKKNKLSNDKKINFRLPNEIHAKLVDKAKKEEKNISKLIRDIIEVYTSI